MKPYVKQIVLAASFGALLAISFFVFTYKPLTYDIDVVETDFELLTEEGNNLGWVFSKINFRYDLDNSLVTIRTWVSEPLWKQSIFSKDVRYRIILWCNSKLVWQLEDSYLGALIPERGRLMYNAFPISNNNKAMSALVSIYGDVVLKIEGTFYNVTSNEVLAKNSKNIHLFIIPPFARVLVFSLLTGVFYIAFVSEDRSPKRYREN